MNVRKAVNELVGLHRLSQSEDRDKTITMRIHTIAKHLPEPVKVVEFIKKLSKHMEGDETMLKLMETISEPDVSCKDSFEAVNQILKKLGAPIMTNLYYGTVKQLLERISSVMVDREAIQLLVKLVKESLENGDIVQELNLDVETASERGLRLLFVLSFVFPSHFLYKDIIKELLTMLGNSADYVAPLVLHILSFIGKHKPINESFPDLQKILGQICAQFIKLGTPKQAKQAVKCMFMNTKTENQEKVFSDILEVIKENLSGEKGKYYLTAIVALGHLAFHLPDKFPVQIKNLVSRKIVKELVMKDMTPARGGEEQWTNDQGELCLETQCKLQGLKMMARWLLGLKNDEVAAQKTYRMLNAIIENGGDLLEEGKPNPAEKSWLRLSAGCAMLKISEQKGVGDQFTSEQFYTLAKLVTDPVIQVREQFMAKLHKGLARGIPNKCLPLDFMGMYALAGMEADKRLRGLTKSYMVADIGKRREYMKTLMLSGGSEKASAELPHIMPDYMLVFSVPLLTHDPAFTCYTDTEYLKRIRQALWFILEPLMLKNENYSFGFYQELIQKMKNMKDALKADDENVNHKMWAVCDLALGIITTRTTNFERKEFLSDARIPSMYFKPHEDPNFQNIISYLPAELQHSQPKKASTTPVGGLMGPPMYTVSGQLAHMDKKTDNVANDVTENGDNISDDLEDASAVMGKRTRSNGANGGGQEAKRGRM